MRNPFGRNQDHSLDIEDYSGLNLDADVIDTIVESSHSETSVPAPSSDDILDEDHWTNDSFEELRVEEEF